MPSAPACDCTSRTTSRTIVGFPNGADGTSLLSNRFVSFRLFRCRRTRQNCYFLLAHGYVKNVKSYGLREALRFDGMAWPVLSQRSPTL